MTQSWRNTQNNSYLINEFNKNGSYPKNNVAQTTKDSSTISLTPNQNIIVFSTSGSLMIDGIQMNIPQLDYW